MAIKGSAAELEKYLKGIDFPCSKSDLISKARANGAPSDVIDELNALPADRFNSPVDVAKAFGQER